MKYCYFYFVIVMNYLPNDILEQIIDKLDIVSLVRLNATCKGYQDIGLKWKLAKMPIHYINKCENTSVAYIDLNDMILAILQELYKSSDCTLNKEYTLGDFTLLVNNYSFTIKRVNSVKRFQFIYDSDNKVYIAIRGIHELPMLFLFIGCKVLFSIHGYTNYNGFAHLPGWFTRVLLNKNYSGLLLHDIVNGFVQV